MKKSLSNVTYWDDENKEDGNKESEGKKNIVAAVGDNNSHQAGVMQLPGIFISQFDSSEADECDGGSLYYDFEPAARGRCQSYSAGGGGAGTRCTLMVCRRDGGRRSFDSSSAGAGLFSSQRSLPCSSKCSSRLGVGDSGWEGDVSQEGSLSNVSHKDWTGGPSSVKHSSSVTTSTSMNFFLPFGLRRCQTAEQKLVKTSTSTLDAPRGSSASGITTRYLSVKSETTSRSSELRDNDQVQRQSLGVARGRQVPDVHLSISSSNLTLTGVESALVKVSVDDDDSDNAASEQGRGARTMTTPTKRRRPLRQRQTAKSCRGAELTTIWINHHYFHQQHTDDSDVERRVERLLYEIDHSVTDSVDESKIRSQEFEILSD